ncbi:hypothetical protein GCM10009838_39970 [Catenulispora subtropica]|uniref:Uncharacterized protein n=1 Tax=Catenulispora subtropica TaxID=450798 RepID=A0ABP5D8B3_9ACTN
MAGVGSLDVGAACGGVELPEEQADKASAAATAAKVTPRERRAVPGSTRTPIADLVTGSGMGTP